jgi:hypothetical protein
MATFTYFGDELSYAEEFPAFEYAEFAEALAEDEIDNTRATGVALRLAAACVAETDRGVPAAVPAAPGQGRRLAAGLPGLDGGRRRAPYWAAHRLLGWATDTQRTSDSEPVASVTPISQERPARGDLALAAVPFPDGLTIRDVCDIAYDIRRERHERAVLALAPGMEDPFQFVDSAMAAFDVYLQSDPGQSSDAVMDQRIAELLEEAA